MVITLGIGGMNQILHPPSWLPILSQREATSLSQGRISLLLSSEHLLLSLLIYQFSSYLKDTCLCSLYLKKKQDEASPFDKASIQKLISRIEKLAGEKGLSLSETTPNTRARLKNVIAKPFHGLGMVVPYNKKSQLGYREIPETTGQFAQIMCME